MLGSPVIALVGEGEDGQMAELFVLGATGYVGSEVVRVALARGHRVRALVRRAEAAARLETLGVLVTRGDVSELRQSIDQARQADVIIDLIQPRLPARLTEAQADRISAYRRSATQCVLDAIRSLPASLRPLLISASGVEELAPDERGLISHRSPLTDTPTGFGRIGVPVCRQVQASGLDHAFVHLGIVYGPGKAFAAKIVPGVARGRMPVIGDGANRTPLTSLRDAARAIVHLVEQPRESLRGRRYLATDGQPTTQRELLDHIAAWLGVRRPLHIPLWLGRLALGSVMVEVLTLDAQVDNSALLDSGFWFEHPSLREGVPAMLAQLGYALTPNAPGARPPEKRREQRPQA